jgi:hypothetical protein
MWKCCDWGIAAGDCMRPDAAPTLIPKEIETVIRTLQEFVDLWIEYNNKFDFAYYAEGY